MSQAIKITIDDKCLENLVDIIEGKKVLDKEETEILVITFRQIIKDYRWRRKMDMTMKGLTCNCKKT
jgi:hypothetical protein